jgi:hypothetical protein
MSGPETIISRWSRLKREPDRDRESEPRTAGAEPVGGDAATAAPAGASEPATPAFDPASSPAIESITAGTDIRSFLQAGVPAELTLAALRRAWAADTAIRDFIGIAENQWDFTDPTAIPGFGLLSAVDDVPVVAGQMLGGADDALRRTSEAALPAAPVGADDERGGSVLERRQGSESLPKGRVGADGASRAGEQDKAEDPECGTRRNRRSHGSALPQ